MILHEERLQGVDMRVVACVESLAEKAMKQMGRYMIIVFGYRSIEEQNKLYAQGRTTAGKIVTRARGGSSPHNFNCYDEQTEVLTANGWKLFSDILFDDKIMCYNNGNLIYELPLAYIKKQYNGKMIKISTRSLDLLVTPEHNFIADQNINKKWRKFGISVAADKLTQHHRIPTRGSFIGETEIDYPFNDSINAEDWWSFMGYYLAEGSCCGVSDGIKRKHTSRFKITISQVKTSEWFEHIKDILTRMGVKYNYFGHDFIFHSKKIWEVLFPLGNKYQKHIPRYLLNAPKNLLKLLFDSMVNGDGHKYSDSHSIYCTTSKKLADDFSELCVKLGYSNVLAVRDCIGDKSVIRGKIVTSKNIKYEISTRANSHQQLRNGGGLDRIKSINYNGFVYCVTTNSGYLVVRRNGKVCISGNCAIDCWVMSEDGKTIDWNNIEYKNLAREHAASVSDKIVWGGNFKSIPDMPHFELKSWRNVRAGIEKIIPNTI